MKTKVLTKVKWVSISISILLILFLAFGILAVSDRVPKESHYGKLEKVMVGYIKDGNPIVHYPSFYNNDSLLLKNISGSDPSSTDSVYISPFMEISNGAQPLIGWAFPRWELIIDKYTVRKGRKFTSMGIIYLEKSQGYFYVQVIMDLQGYKRKIRISAPDQLPSCAIPR